MIFDGFMIVATILCAASVVIGVLATILRDYPSDAAIISLAVVEVYLVVYGIAAGIRQAGGEELVGAGWEFWGYLATALVLVLLAGWWAIGENSRYSNLVMAAASFTVFVMLFRMQQVWLGQGWF